MLSLISPAKSQNFKDKAPVDISQPPKFETEIYQLVELLQQYEPHQIASLMSISDKLAVEVYDKYAKFKKDFSENTAKQALFTFSGDVYRGLDAATLSEENAKFANDHLLMISGLYGLLKPFDLIQPYRLEMGSKLDVNGQSLYQFWRLKLTNYLNELLAKEQTNVVVNLASKEYSSAFDKKLVNGDWVDVDFKEYRQGKYKIIGIFAKRARGLMTRFIIDQEINHTDKLIDFNYEGYQFNEELSKPHHLIFTRNQSA
ncbi:peroxide stress protein YaaA [Thiotrichales bacterium 19S3-7]|nr:peroxide stress protein YaaA [Thiotrichales bacterium 19S3-7]MCF6802430.1 peroxide stress protein YaaA [Thiotrichales bacterium 19S3-11]